MITIENVSKRRRRRRILDDVTFEARPGRVTGFVGPNGAGKSSTMRVLLGLDRPDAGRALVNGVPYREFAAPLREVGALVDGCAAHRSRTGRAHLRWLAASNGIDARRVDDVLDTVELEGAAHRRVGTYSLGMRQRLGLAAALLGDPAVLVLDEPANGLDPAGIRWLRELLRGFAREARTVLLSSHLMGEVADTADDLVVIAGGTIRSTGTVHDLVAGRASLEEAYLDLTGGDRAAQTQASAGAHDA